MGHNEAIRPAREFLSDASTCLWEASRSAFPEAMEASDAIRLSGRRLLEAAAEHCEAMDVLQTESFHRPAHALLRVLLETIACFVWLSVDPAPHAGRLWNGRLPAFKNTLDRIGWAPEYDRTYRLLSGFVHPTEDQLHMYRKVDTGTADGLAPEICPDGEIYALPNVKGIPYVSFSPMSHEEAEGMYGLYVRVKAVDLVFAGLIDAFDVQVSAARWWPTRCESEFRDLLQADEALAAKMLNRIDGRHLAREE